jgi:predicted lactoylglutathione lyase
MPHTPVVVSLPVADRRTSFEFYRRGLGLEAIGEPAEDGVPEPLQFKLSEGTRLMLVPTGGFGWVIGSHQVAQRGHSECFISLSAGTPGAVDTLVSQARQAGADVVTEPAQQPWGYAGAFCDPDGHIWIVTSEPPPSEIVSAVTTIKAPAEAIFGILADPASHPAIDGTGWIQEALDREPLTAAGQIFRMAMHHDNHPDGDYQMANKVLAFDPPRVVSWEPGYDAGDGNLRFGGWIWRYDLTPVSLAETEVRLSYDWSAVPAEIRERIKFPPFPPDHLINSLSHLSGLAAPDR